MSKLRLILLCKTIFLILFSICSICFLNIKQVYGEQNDAGYQYFYDNKGNGIFAINMVEDGTIYFFGLHAKSNANVTYHTTGYMLSLKNSEDLNPVTTDNYAFIPRNETDDKKVEIPFGNSRLYSTDQYVLNAKDVTDTVIRLLKSSGKTSPQAYRALAKGVTVYFSNVFEVIYRNGSRIGSDVYYSCRDIIDAPKKLLGCEWSSMTQELLPYYYNNPITIKLLPYKYDVVYVDYEEFSEKKRSYTPLQVAKEDEVIIFGQKVAYELPEKIQIHDSEYEYVTSRYYFSNGKSNTIHPILSNGQIVTEHERRFDSTLYIFVKKKTSQGKEPGAEQNEIPDSNPGKYSYFNTDAVAKLGSNEYGKEIYNTLESIPSEEQLYGMIQTKDYLLNIEYTVRKGTVTYPITVNKAYTIQNKEKTKPTQPVIVTQQGTISRDYQYVELTKIEYYQIRNGSISSAVLPTGMIQLTPDAYQVPTLNYKCYPGSSAHLQKPSGISNTINLDGEIVEKIPFENLIALADLKIGQIHVRNDRLSFGGTVILNDSWTSQSTSAFQASKLVNSKITEPKMLYQDHLVIPTDLDNGCYATTASVTYECVTNYHSTLPSLLTFSISNTNPVTIHTPVYCEAVVQRDNEKYMQLQNFHNNCIPLILDENPITSDFTVRISNTGYHSNKQGYQIKNYSPYVATKQGRTQNEIRFGMDVFYDVGGDGNCTNDVLLTRNQWYLLGSISGRFYLPMWTKEGCYQVEVRSVASNGASHMEQTEIYKNTELSKYVATDSFWVEVCGRMYGLTLYDVADYPLWESVFRIENSNQLKRRQDKLKDEIYGFKSSTFEKNAVYDYTAGINDAYGIENGRLNKYTYPLINGAHPQYSNQGLIKSGYLCRFLLTTVGNVMSDENATVHIQTRFYYVDSQGMNREEVDLYYTATRDNKRILMKVGNENADENSMSISLGSLYLGIPKWQLISTAKRKGVTFEELSNTKVWMNRYEKLVLTNVHRVDTNQSYAEEYSDLAKLPVEALTALKQTYYFQYVLPVGVKAVSKGFDVLTYGQTYGLTGREDFFKKDGYLIVNFDITAFDGEGNAYYHYTNRDNYLNYGHCCMWKLEGMTPTRTDSKGKVFTFKAGDVLLYSTEETASDDYIVKGLY